MSLAFLRPSMQSDITFAGMKQTYPHDQVVPDKDSTLSKKEQVAAMFDSIAPRYDRVNRILSGGIDVRWRKKALSFLKPLNPKIILDVATGTADVAILMTKMLHPEKVIGIDISEGMLEGGRTKIKNDSLEKVIELRKGDSETINFPEHTFDAVTVSFGVRNFENLEKGLQEIYRVLKPGGRLVILEFSKPKFPLMAALYRFYMQIAAPQVAGWISKNKQAYEYLDNSINAFPEGNDFLNILRKSGFKQTECERLTFGIASIYIGDK
jgi:demethylmenaquinone methyltransferase/2-methoxy-6-polyprenyl-1,4-benzoquinol methylase